MNAACCRTAQLAQPQLRPAFTAWRAAYATGAAEWLAGFTNYEQKGLPTAAGTDTADGFDLGGMCRLLACLGSPQDSWAAVHVAGTKGKGSTVAMLAGVLRESGYRVGSYMSPHVASLHERICIDSVPISTTSLDALVSRHAAEIEAQQEKEGGRLTHFEVLTALAFKYFQEAAVDVAVVETGLGGARDATNVLPADSLQVAVITAVGGDHAAALGGSIESIAAAKAGIMKSGCPVVIAQQPEAAAAGVLLQHAARLDCKVVHADEQVECRAGAVAPFAASGSSSGLRQWGQLVLKGSTARALLPPGASAGSAATAPLDLNLRLLGAHQLDNAAAAACAAAVLRQQGFGGVTLQSVARGVEAASLPGRFQVCRLAAGEEGAAGPGPPLVVLDGAHTAESGKALVDTLLVAFPGAPVAVVLAMAADKPHRQFCAQLRRLSPAAVVFTEVPVAGSRARSAPPGVLAAAWQAAATLPGAARPAGGGRTRELIQASLRAAVGKARTEVAARGEGGVVVVCGSLHAVGAALRQLELTAAAS